MTQPPAPFATDSATRQRLLRTALRMFSERGYSEVSLKDIVEACELTKGAVYWYFASKEALFHAAVSEYLYSWEQRVMEELGSAGTWDEQLGAVFRHFIEVLEDPEDPHRDLLLLMTLRGAGGPGQHTVGFASLQRFTGWIEAVLATHPDKVRRAGYVAMVHATGLGVLSETAYGSDVARPALSAVFEALGGGELFSAEERRLTGRPALAERDASRRARPI